MFFNTRKKGAVHCYAFHFLEVKSVAKKMVEELIEYFSSKHNIWLKSFYSFDYKYRDYGGPVDKIFSVASPKKWSELEQITLYTSQHSDDERMLKIQYSPTSPSQLVISIDSNIPFMIKDIAGKLLTTHSIFYGYKYTCTSFRACTAYAGGGPENRKCITDLPSSRLKEKIIFRWRLNWEAINGGLIRDVYSENLLTGKQLNNIAGNRPLIEIIKSDKLGQIDEVAQSSYHWAIDDRLLSSARAELYKYDIFV